MADQTGRMERAAPPQPATEIRSLTGLRGLAAIYVVVFHYFSGLRLSNALTMFLAHGYLAVDLFFVLSGFVMARTYGHKFACGWSKRTYLQFLGRRIARIYPVYLVATAAGFILVAAGYLEAPRSDYTRIVALGLNFAMIQVWGLAGSFDGPAWSISAEWAAYILFPGVLIRTLYVKAPAAWIACSGCAGTLAAICTLPGFFFQASQPRLGIGLLYLPWHALPLLRCLPEFTLGILAFRLSTTSFGRSTGSSRWIPPLLCIAMLALLAIPETDLPILFLLPFLVVSMASGTHVPGQILGSAPAELLGRLSYGIYLTHELLGGVLKRLTSWTAASGLVHSTVYAAIAAIALTFCIASLAYRFIEVPGRYWLRALFERGSVTESAMVAQPSVTG